MKIIAALVLWCLILCRGYAQEVHGKTDVWFLLLNHYTLSEKWRVGNELHLRRDDWFRDQQQFLLRPFVDFRVNASVTLTAGYTYIITSPYGKYPLPGDLPEHNFWEQVNLAHSIGKVSLGHRYRVEHRFQGDFVDDPSGETMVDGFSFSNRFRYRLTARIPIDETWFIQSFDEVFLNYDGARIAEFDRNWIFAAIGRKVLDGGSILLGYMHHWARNNPTRFEEHPTVQLVVGYDF